MFPSPGKPIRSSQKKLRLRHITYVFLVDYGRYFYLAFIIIVLYIIVCRISDMLQLLRLSTFVIRPIIVQQLKASGQYKPNAVLAGNVPFPAFLAQITSFFSIKYHKN